MEKQRLKSNLDVSCVYMIKNIVNNKVYIGSTKNLRNRMYAHNHLLKHGKHDSSRLQEDWDNGDIFEVIVLKEIEDEDKLRDCEQYFIDYYESYNESNGYNIYRNSESPLGHKYRDEVKDKLSKLRKGKNNPFYGKSHSDESRDKISKSKIGKKLSKEHKEKLIGTAMGSGTKFYTEDTYNKLSEKNRGEGNATAKLKEEDVIEILEHIKNKTMTYKEISKHYNISLAQISRIKNGKRWGYLKEVRGDLYE